MGRNKRNTVRHFFVILAIRIIQRFDQVIRRIGFQNEALGFQLVTLRGIFLVRCVKIQHNRRIVFHKPPGDFNTACARHIDIKNIQIRRPIIFQI